MDTDGEGEQSDGGDFGVRCLVTAFTRRLVAVELREASVRNGAFTARASASTPAWVDAH